MVSAELGGSWDLSAPLKTQCNPISELYEKKAAMIFYPRRVPEYMLCKGKRESVRYVNINIYEINPEVSTLLWLWMS